MGNSTPPPSPPPPPSQREREEQAHQSYINECRRKLKEGEVMFLVGPRGSIMEFIVRKDEIEGYSKVINESIRTSQRVVSYTEVTQKGFGAFVRFLKTKVLSFDGIQELVELFQVCLHFGICSLTDQCRSLCQTNMSDSNVCSILRVVDRHYDTALTKECMKFISGKTSQVFNSADFLKATPQVVKIIAENTRLSLQSEGQLFTALLNWAKEECRRKQRPSTPAELRSILRPLLAHVRFLDMTADEFVQVVVREQILNKEEEHAILVNVSQDMEDIVPIPKDLSKSRTCRLLSKETQVPIAIVDTTVYSSFDDIEKPVTDHVPASSVFQLTVHVGKGVIEMVSIELSLQHDENNTPIEVRVTATVTNTRNGRVHSTVFSSSVDSSNRVDCHSLQGREAESITLKIEFVEEEKCSQFYKLGDFPICQNLGDTFIMVKENIGIPNFYMSRLNLMYK